MYKAFVVDDDYAAIEGIYNSFDWKRLNIEDVVLINTPHNVTDRIKEEKPDVVFIDIEMGELSGLDIIEQAKKEGSAVWLSLLLILSSFLALPCGQSHGGLRVPCGSLPKKYPSGSSTP